MNSNPDLLSMAGKAIQQERMREAEVWRMNQANRRNQAGSMSMLWQRLAAAARQVSRVRAFPKQPTHHPLE